MSITGWMGPNIWLEQGMSLIDRRLLRSRRQFDLVAVGIFGEGNDVLLVPCFIGPGSRTILMPLARSSSQAL